MRSRIATVLTLLALVAATGGAIALGEGGSSGSVQGGAASGQYKPGKGCGKPGQHRRGGACKPKHKKKPVHKKKPSHKGSYHCTYHQVGQNLVGNCRFY